MNKTDALWIRAEKVKPLEGFQDIFCHADKYSLVWRDAAGNETIVSAEQFCKILEDSPVYKGGNIRLMACESGADGAIVAQYVADYFGIDVWAPSDKLWLDFDGNITIGPNEYTNNGEWRLFSPKK